MPQAAPFIFAFIVSAMVSYAMRPKKREPEGVDFRSALQGRTVNLRQALVAHRVLYGRSRHAGNLSFIESTGTNSEFLHLVVTLGSAGPYEELGDIYIDDVLVTSADINGSNFVTLPQFQDADGNPLIRIKKHLGAHNQGTDGDLETETAVDGNFKGGGIAYVYARIKWDQDVFQQRPNIAAVVKGRKVYDPRGSPEQDPSDPSTWTYSANAALCVLDYIRGAPHLDSSGTIVRRFGVNAEDADIDMDAWATAADVCDEQVELKGSPSEFENRYEIHGPVDTKQSPFEILNDLKTAFSGTVLFTGGKWMPSVGEYNAPTITLDEDDLRGPIEVQPKTQRRDLFNAVKGVFVSPDHSWQATDYPPITISAYETEDNGRRIWGEVDLPFTTSSEAAQRLAKATLELSRRQISVSLKCKLTAFRVRAGTVIGLTNDRFAWTDKPFYVTSWRLVADADGEGTPFMGVDIELREIDSNVWVWNGETDAGTISPRLAPTLPDPFTVAPPTGLTVTSGTSDLFLRIDGTVFSRLGVSWTAPADINVTSGGLIEIQYKKSSDSTWEKWGTVPGNETNIHILDVEDGEAYDVAARSINNLGVRSDRDSDPGNWTAMVLSHTVIGKTEVPPDVDTFNVSRLPDGTRRFTWSLSPVPADVKAGGGYQIKYKSGTGHTWADLTNLHEGLWALSPFETNELGPGTYTFGIKAVDSSGNESANALLLEITLGNPRQRDTILFFSAFDEVWPIDPNDSNFVLGSPSADAGLRTDCFVNYEGFLESVGDTGSPQGDWTSFPEGSPSSWGDLPDRWDAAVPNVADIEYRTGVFDLGADLNFVPIISMSLQQGGSWTMYIRVQTEAEGPAFDTVDAGSPTTAWQSTTTSVFPQQTGRYFQFRVDVNSDPSVLISDLTITIDGEVVLEDYEDINTASSTDADFYSIAPGHFRIGSRGTMTAIRTAQITALQNVGPGYTWELISKETTLPGSPNEDIPAAEFKIYDETDTLADATVDVTIKGLKLPA